MTTYHDDSHPEDAPTVAGRWPMGNEDVTIIDPGPMEPSALAVAAVDEPPTHEAIAAEAYAIFQARGGHHGGDTDDWFEAERRLRERRGSRD
jgi:hypothetical protein